MILLIGVSTRAMLESARKGGFSVAALDFFADWDAHCMGKVYSLGQDFGWELNTKNLLKAAKLLPYTDLVYASGVEHYPEELCHWEEKGLLRGNSPESLRAVRNPWLLRNALGKIGVQMPPFYSLEHLFGLEGDRPTQRLIIKPLHRGGGSGIIFLPLEEEGLSKHLQEINKPQDYIVQAFVEGVPASMTFLADGQEAIVIGTSRQLSGDGIKLFMYSGNIVPLALGYGTNISDFEGRLTQIALHLTKVFKLKGLNTMDFIIAKDGIKVLEVNPRWSGSVELLERQLGFSLFPYHYAANGIRHLEIELKEMQKHRESTFGSTNFWGKRIVYAAQAIRVRHDLDRDFLLAMDVRDIPLPGSLIGQGHPLCTVIAEGKTEEECLENLQSKGAWVEAFLAN